MGDYIVVGVVAAIIIVYICSKGGIRRTPKNIDLYEYYRDERSGKYTPSEMRERVYAGYYTKKNK